MSARDTALPPSDQSGKAAFAALIRAFGGQDAAAADCGVRQQKLSDMGLPNVAIFPTLDLIDHFEARTVGAPGWPHVTRYLAARRGMMLSAPRPAAGSTGWVARIGDLARESGEIVGKIAAALADDALSSGDVRGSGVLADLEDLIAVAVALRGAVQSVVEDGR